LLLVDLLQLLVAGVSLGCVYALVALGFVLIYKATETVNFAQGDLMMLGAFFALTGATVLGLPYWLTIAFAIAVMALVGMLIERIVLRPVLGHPAFTVVMVTIGAGFVLRGVVTMIPGWGTETYALATPFADKVMRVGGVVIAERHSAQRSEAARLLAKGIEGCTYFISQTVYHAPPTQRLLRDYLRDCRGAGVAPRRVILTFAPCGREKTLAFLRWLGVNVAPETERAILGAPSPLAKSIEICRDNLRRILDGAYRDAIPLGVNVESVSINRDEIDASVELFHALKETLEGR